MEQREQIIIQLITTIQNMFNTYETYLNESNKAYIIAERNNFNNMHECAIISFSQIKCCGYDSYKQNFIKCIEQLLNPSFIINKQISKDNFNNVALLELNIIQKYLSIINNAYYFDTHDDENIIKFYIEHLYFQKWSTMQDHVWNNEYKRRFVNSAIIDANCYFYHKDYQLNLQILKQHGNQSATNN